MGRSSSSLHYSSLFPFFSFTHRFYLFVRGGSQLSCQNPSCFLGGLVAAILFESAKHAFAYYLIRYNTYELLYGAFATVPIFFIWVYWVWIITLLGAEISYAFSVHHQRRGGKSSMAFHMRCSGCTSYG
ncbi:YihY/virulence factor BrkB family protein [Legionella pneumophila]|nr:YihY/virulence factor BrkB family protein [Legionella pneumophila]